MWLLETFFLVLLFYATRNNENHLSSLPSLSCWGPGAPVGDPRLLLCQYLYKCIAVWLFNSTVSNDVCSSLSFQISCVCLWDQKLMLARTVAKQEVPGGTQGAIQNCLPDKFLDMGFHAKHIMMLKKHCSFRKFLDILPMKFEYLFDRSLVTI